MANVIRIKKGLDIPLAGMVSDKELSLDTPESYGITPDNFHGLIPRLSVQVGDRVLAGSPVMYHRTTPELLLTSPVSGEVVNIVRGAKRKILYVEIKADPRMSYKEFNVQDVARLNSEETLSLLLESGLFALIKQRPYDIVANPHQRPRDIFVTGCFTAPLMPNALSLIQEDKQYLQVAVDALSKLTEGSVYVSRSKGDNLELKGVETYEVEGPHPAGNVGVLINHVAPINKGEVVWTLSLTELTLIGRFLTTGKVDLSRRVAIAGSRMKSTGYTTLISGAMIPSVVSKNTISDKGHVRIIDGDVLTGTALSDTYKFLSPFSNIITAIPEGDDVHALFGWATPGFGKFSHSRSFPTFLFGKKKYDIDARFQGGKRAIIVSGEYEKVFPMDIYPEQLVKSIIAFDIERMEALGIYEVAPEDFALCEFVCTSKLELQYIVRQGLDRLYKEMN